MNTAPDAFADNYRSLARYNRWFNERLYYACERLPDAQRRADRGAFFGSVHRTLNHVLWADRLWLGRFARQDTAFAALRPEVTALPPGDMHGAVLSEDWADLRQARAAVDAAIEAWLAEVPADWPVRTIRYANTKGVQREQPAWQALTHFFNHQAHHRGQVTTLLAQAGIDPGDTDLVAMP